MGLGDRQAIIDGLQRNWVWVSDWQDASAGESAGSLVTFRRAFVLQTKPSVAEIACSADTRYKLLVNGNRVAVGPTRSLGSMWHYDVINIAPWLRQGPNEVKIIVLRFFPNIRAGLPFVRTHLPGLTVLGTVETADLSTLDPGWTATFESQITFPTEEAGDVFLHITEAVSSKLNSSPRDIIPYDIVTANGELSPWRLTERSIPMPEQTPLDIHKVSILQSPAPDDWHAFVREGRPIVLFPETTHVVDLVAEHHSTAFIRWSFSSSAPASFSLKATYSEAYEREPRVYPWLRTKSDRLDSTGMLIGPTDDLQVIVSHQVSYEPFWFRTFRIVRLELVVEDVPVTLESLAFSQVNYPVDFKAEWRDEDDIQGDQIMQVSKRTIRNCLFDGYSDCPFYEQLQYSGDSRTVALFHYLLSGDDRLARQAISLFAASVTPEGLTQSRVPSHVPQLIAAFPLYWILMLCDHFLFFGDSNFTRRYLPTVDGILEYFARHVDSLGLVSGIPPDVWQYVDWVDTWHSASIRGVRGVPTAGRETNRHTYFSMIYAYVLRRSATLCQQVARLGLVDEYNSRAESVISAIQKHCYDGEFFTDSTVDIREPHIYSQHCQVFAVLCGAARPDERKRLLLASRGPTFSKCSYFMMFYVFRAYAAAGIYEDLYSSLLQPWRSMLSKNLSTWEEDDVRQRSDCHAWGCVPVYEFLAEVAGVWPIRPGCQKIKFAPRIRLSKDLKCRVALGKDRIADVCWKRNGDVVSVSLVVNKPVEIRSVNPEGVEEEHGLVSFLSLSWTSKL